MKLYISELNYFYPQGIRIYCIGKAKALFR